MRDPRVTGQARLLVRYCLRARSRQTIGVAGASAAEPLIAAVYEELLRAGAFPVVTMLPTGAEEAFFRCARPHHFDALTPYQQAHARTVDAMIHIQAAANTRALSGVRPDKQARLARATAPLRNVLGAKPYVITIFPTAAFAQDAEMSLGEFEDMVFAAMFADQPDPAAAWRALRARQQRLIARLAGAKDVRIVGAGTDLTFSLRGRRFINSDGRRNMPSGEVFSAPVEDSAEGAIEFDFPACHAGRAIESVRLVFRRGVVVEAGAARNEPFLRAMLKTDAGASRLGEFGIGTNPRLRRFTRNILLDEKIGGTIHLALGRAYPEAGGLNRSAIHWDLIKDLRRGGAVYVDGRPFQRDGRLVCG